MSSPRKTLQKLSQGACRPTKSGQTITGVYDDLVVPAGVTDLRFYHVIILGDVTVHASGTRGEILRPTTAQKPADLGGHNGARGSGVVVLRRCESDLVQIHAMWG